MSIESAPSAGFRLAPMTESDAIAISSWHYPPPYEMYNWIPWKTALEQERDYAVPKIRRQQFRSVYYGGELCGFVQWFPLLAEDGSRAVIRLGLGLRPDWCGKGRGADFAAFLAATAAQGHPGCEIDLEVAAANVRAIRAYKRAGFIIAGEYELPSSQIRGDLVYCMVWNPVPSKTTSNHVETCRYI